MEMQGSDKYKPNFDVAHLPAEEQNDAAGEATQNNLGWVQFVFHVSEESSAKEIDVSVNKTELKLSSPNYELHEKFKDFAMD